MRQRPLLFALILAAGTACHGSDSTGPSIASTTFASSLGVNLAAMKETSDGLYYQDTKLGSGTVASSTSAVTVSYAGYFPDGTEFDASSEHGGTFAFQLGAGTVIQGWEEGVPGMAVGGTRLLVIPPALAYGSQGAGSIPPNAILVFTIQLVAASQ